MESGVCDELCVMFFGLTNSLATFQALMNLIFADAGKVTVYLNDILIFSLMKAAHRETSFGGCRSTTSTSDWKSASSTAPKSSIWA